MTQGKKVIWTEGMFLRPHHFQQSDEYIEQYVNHWGICQSPFFWGFKELKLDEALFSQGKISVQSASGIMPDGTPFSFNNSFFPPAPLTIPNGGSNITVVLAMPARALNRHSVIFEEKKDTLARYITYEEEVHDMNEISVSDTTVQFARPRLRIMTENDLTAEWTSLKIALVLEKANDHSLRLDAKFIPPILGCNVSQLMSDFIRDLYGLLRQRSKEISQRLIQPDRIGVSEVNDFMMLELVNRYTGYLSHLDNLPQIHPESVFCELLKFACDLATFSEKRVPDRNLPKYDHDDLALCFNQLINQLRQGLAIALTENAVLVELQERSYGLYVSVINDLNMFSQFSFVIAVHAEVAKEMLLMHYPNQVKVGPITQIANLVRLQLPGVTLRFLPVAPRQIPYHTGYTYFELDGEHEMWKQIETTGGIAVHVAGDFPGLKMELWAIRG